MEQATYDEVRRKMADTGRDRFSVLIPDTVEALDDLFEMVQSGEVWWNDGGQYDPIAGGRQRVKFVRLGSEAAEKAHRAAAQRDRR